VPDLLRRLTRLRIRLAEADWRSGVALSPQGPASDRRRLLLATEGETALEVGPLACRIREIALRILWTMRLSVYDVADSLDLPLDTIEALDLWRFLVLPLDQLVECLSQAIGPRADPRVRRALRDLVVASRAPRSRET
jgi:hypothetical protein